MDSEKILVIVVVSCYLFLVTAMSVHLVFGLSGDDIPTCDDSICAQSINKEIANEEIVNHTTNNITHHSVIMWPWAKLAK